MECMVAFDLTKKNTLHFISYERSFMQPIFKIIVYGWVVCMDIKEYIKKNVANYYWGKDVNCATTMLNVLSKIYQVNLENQVINAAIGMHGAGSFGAQCGLVEGALMFIGILGEEKGLSNEAIIDLCYCYAKEFEEKFSSLVCKQLRPQGFKLDNPPHLCEDLTNQAVQFAIKYLEKNVPISMINLDK